jgi:hypothetical protein
MVVPSHIRTEVVMISPAVAREYLTHNVRNYRKFSEWTANKYARDMQLGRWHWNAVPIAFDEHGHLIEGQHRMHAVIISGVTVPMQVAWGLDERAAETFDIGRPRTIGDALHHRDIPNARNMSSLGRRIWEWIELGPSWNFSHSGRVTPSNQEIIELVADDPSIIDACNYAMTARHYVPALPSVMGLAYWVFRPIDAECFANFFYDLEKQTDLAENDPVYTLIRRLRYDASKVQGQRHGSADNEPQMAMFCLAWNARREHRSLSRIVLKPDGDFPRPR